MFVSKNWRPTWEIWTQCGILACWLCWVDVKKILVYNISIQILIYVDVFLSFFSGTNSTRICRILHLAKKGHRKQAVILGGTTHGQQANDQSSVWYQHRRVPGRHDLRKTEDDHRLTLTLGRDLGL